ncbi:hypothetical protein I302_101348 [Kwoniella bestiolae CBS 10118]|uniref:Uncharacterized protein n=1 Tax=Kwoniella bestiolae CBS 10118 TaxID=1296100 RepID=A0A1B9GC19_9TREE|nr:hypothetical protein I302_00031 [Kwoniella bestiolae CBS 10118]OCF28544.1 hypothetical protein I302_00031 [Kwoniella bestiolae CBS 10118]
MLCDSQVPGWLEFLYQWDNWVRRPETDQEKTISWQNTKGDYLAERDLEENGKFHHLNEAYDGAKSAYDRFYPEGMTKSDEGMTPSLAIGIATCAWPPTHESTETLDRDYFEKAKKSNDFDLVLLQRRVKKLSNPDYSYARYGDEENISTRYNERESHFTWMQWALDQARARKHFLDCFEPTD